LDYGENWIDEGIIYSGDSLSLHKSLSLHNNYLGLVWDSANDAYFMYSDNNGDSWSKNITITNESVPWLQGKHHVPVISLFGKKFHIIWTEYAEKKGIIYYMKFDLEQKKLSEKKKLTEDLDCYPISIIAYENTIFVFYYHNRDNEPDFYLITSNNNGGGWEKPVKICVM
jgi:hypothetical protein